jgi:hypothetical protein
MPAGRRRGVATGWHPPSVSAGCGAGTPYLLWGYAARMPTWEYATVPLIVHATKQILDQWGEDGWELVTVVPGPDGQGLVAYMKRQRK